MIIYDVYIASDDIVRCSPARCLSRHVASRLEKKPVQRKVVKMGHVINYNHHHHQVEELISSFLTLSFVDKENNFLCAGILFSTEIPDSAMTQSALLLGAALHCICVIRIKLLLLILIN